MYKSRYDHYFIAKSYPHPLMFYMKHHHTITIISLYFKQL